MRTAGLVPEIRKTREDLHGHQDLTPRVARFWTQKMLAAAVKPSRKVAATCHPWPEWHPGLSWCAPSIACCPGTRNTEALERASGPKS